jgi:hypothetical protein
MILLCQMEKFASLGIVFDANSSVSVGQSLSDYEADPKCRNTVFPALSHLLMKAMHLAKYFCAGTARSQAEFRHYALAVDMFVFINMFC